MSQLLTISQITQEALPVLSNKLALTAAVSKQYSKEFAVTGAKIGNVVNVRVPPRYTVSSGPALDLQDSVETYTPVTLTNQDHVDIPFNSADLTLSVDDYRDRFIVPAMEALANKIDYNGATTLYKKVANHIGTPGSLSGYTTSQQVSTYILQAGQKLLENGAPSGADRAFLVNPQGQTNLVSCLTNQFNPAGTISKMFGSGAMGDNVLGFNFAATQNIPNHTYGTYIQGTSTAITVSGAVAGNTGPGTDRTAPFGILVTGGNGTTLTAGTVVTLGSGVSSVYEVNPQNRASTGQLKQFVVTQDFSCPGASTGTLYVWPAPVFSGAFQNAYSSGGNIAAGAAVVTPIISAASAQYAQNLAFHPAAFTLATADLELIQTGAESARANWKGVSLRTLKTYIPGTDQQVLRLDVLYGWAAPYPELAVRCTA